MCEWGKISLHPFLLKLKSQFSKLWNSAQFLNAQIVQNQFQKYLGRYFSRKFVSELLENYQSAVPKFSKKGILSTKLRFDFVLLNEV